MTENPTCIIKTVMTAVAKFIALIAAFLLVMYAFSASGMFLFIVSGLSVKPAMAILGVEGALLGIGVYYLLRFLFPRLHPNAKVIVPVAGVFISMGLAFYTASTFSFYETLHNNRRALVDIRRSLHEYKAKYGRYPLKLDELYNNGKSTEKAALPALWRIVPAFSNGLAHKENDSVTYYSGEVCAEGTATPMVMADAIKDTGSWGYVNDRKSPCFGLLFIDCTHRKLMQDRGGK